jgi:hypothetical protein
MSPFAGDMYGPLSFAVVRFATADAYSSLLLLLELLLLLLLDSLLLLLLDSLLLLLLDSLLLLVLDLLLLLLFELLLLLLRSPCAKRAGELL